MSEAIRAQYAKKGPVIAIDGPAGTGKSSATKRLADLLGFVHVDTGALYRAVAFAAREKGIILLEDRLKEALPEETLARVTEILGEIQIEFRRDPQRNPKNRVFLDGKDVTDRIRTPEMSLAASRVSAIPAVRDALFGFQRRMGAEGKTILEGRDIGTVIFPDADVKFFLTATVEERAKRRLAELEAAGDDPPSFSELKHQIEIRDEADRTRAVAPLRKAADAVEFDTTPFTLDEVVEKMADAARKRLSKP